MENIDKLAEEYRNKTPQEIIEFAINRFDNNVAISFSGAEDVVLIDMAVKFKKDVRVFSLDTGRLHPETYCFLDNVRKRYGVKIEVQFPEKEAVEKLVTEKGLYSFYQDDHKECCGIRKVEPLKKILSTLDAWITGQRADQSPSTRSDVPVIQDDTFFGSPEHKLVKFNPLSHWTSRQVWEYIREHVVPYNELHLQGYISIGCQPCTRQVLPNQHEREGRWWWEDATKKECGLHSGNFVKANI